MYDDNSSMEPSNKKRRMNMTLDLQQTANVKPKAEKMLLNSDLLATPDLGMFMLASPELERFIIQPNGGLVLTTPTPTSHVPFPKSVTEEQEAYARGFIDALAELHKNYGPPVSGTSSAPTATASAAGVSATAMPLTSRTVVLTTANPSVNVAATAAGNYVLTAPTQLSVRAQLPTMVAVANNTTVKLESAQTVPAVTTLPLPSSVDSRTSIDIKPIDMDEQEMVKLERKRARNRLAATRCRNRKLERISKLEERVADLKSQNSQLMQSAAQLRDEVCRLKRGIVEHTRRGCQVMLTHSIL
jgi:transcription factor AP-1